MSQKSLSYWLKIIILLMAVCGVAIYLYVMPTLLMPLITISFESSLVSNIWLIILWISAIPCYIVLIFGWMIARNIGINKSFSISNSKYLKNIMIVTIVDSAYFFIINIVMLKLNMNSVLIFVISMVLIFAGIVVATASACLSHLVLKASKLQEQSDLTI